MLRENYGTSQNSSFSSRTNITKLGPVFVCKLFCKSFLHNIVTLVNYFWIILLLTIMTQNKYSNIYKSLLHNIVTVVFSYVLFLSRHFRFHQDHHFLTFGLIIWLLICFHIIVLFGFHFQQEIHKISGVNGRSCKFIIRRLHHLPFTPEIV